MAVAERGISHGMRYQARALAAQTAEKERSCWLAGTTALREENEVHRWSLELPTRAECGCRQNQTVGFWTSDGFVVGRRPVKRLDGRSKVWLLEGDPSG